MKEILVNGLVVFVVVSIAMFIVYVLIYNIELYDSQATPSCITDEDCIEWCIEWCLDTSRADRLEEYRPYCDSNVMVNSSCECRCRYKDLWKPYEERNTSEVQ